MGRHAQLLGGAAWISTVETVVLPFSVTRGAMIKSNDRYREVHRRGGAEARIPGFSCCVRTENPIIERARTVVTTTPLRYPLSQKSVLGQYHSTSLQTNPTDDKVVVCPSISIHPSIHPSVTNREADLLLDIIDLVSTPQFAADGICRKENTATTWH